jgi:group I intron endonuclease
MKNATSLTGYKHTEQARLKMALRLKNKHDHPMFGKKHSNEALALISKPGKLNPMYGKIHSDLTKKIISDRLSKHINGVGIYDLNDNLISKFRNNVELAKHLKISKVTVGKYLNSGFVYNKAYRFKVNNI